MSNAVKIYKHFQTPKSAGVYHRLICLTGDKKGTAYFIMEKERVVLGRAETADVRVLDLKSSREHAEIMQVGEDYILTDLGSQNGIVVNDLKIKQHVLTDGDKIIIGKTVYKFSRIVVKEEEKPQELESDEDYFDEQEAEKDKKLSRILLLIIVLAAIVWGLNGSQEQTQTKKSVTGSGKVAINEIGDDFKEELDSLRKRTGNNEKLDRYFKRGLREYREGNYFRALVEFENAKLWAPKDPTANFYLRKTKEKVNEIISGIFNQGAREKDALNWKAAETKYCQIVRLLVFHAPDDERIAQARENLREIERKRNLDENSIVCIRESLEE